MNPASESLSWLAGCLNVLDARMCLLKSCSTQDDTLGIVNVKKRRRQSKLPERCRVPCLARVCSLGGGGVVVSWMVKSQNAKANTKTSDWMTRTEQGASMFALDDNNKYEQSSYSAGQCYSL